MKKQLVLAAVGSIFALGAVQAQSIDDRINNESVERNNLQVVEQGRLTSDRLIGSYRGIDNDDSRLRAGAQVYNEAARLTGEVTGNITVLMNNADANVLANQFGLNVVYTDSNSGIAQLNAAGHDDLVALVEALKASDLVRAARLDIFEKRYTPDVITR